MSPNRTRNYRESRSGLSSSVSSISPSSDASVARFQGWRGKKASWLAIAGFAIVMFTYLGMSLLPTAAESAWAHGSPSIVFATRILANRP